MHLDVRQAQPKDAGWIAEIWNHIIDDTLVTFTTVPKTIDDITGMIATRPVLVLPNGAGFATYGPFRGGPGYAATVEHTIYIAQDAQGAGQGAHLLGALCDHATAQGHHVMVAAISGANPGAVRFHARAGFAEVAHMREVGRKNGQRLDLILMQKHLTPTDTPAAAR